MNKWSRFVGGLIMISLFVTMFVVAILSDMATPPQPTPTPAYFSVVVKIDTEPQITGDDWGGFSTWFVGKVISADRTFNAGELYNIRFEGTETRRFLRQGMTIRLSCRGELKGRLLCDNVYEIPPSNTFNI